MSWRFVKGSLGRVKHPRIADCPVVDTLGYDHIGIEKADRIRFHADRVVGGHRHYLNSGGPAASCVVPREGESLAHQMLEQSETDLFGFSGVRG